MDFAQLGIYGMLGLLVLLALGLPLAACFLITGVLGLMWILPTSAVTALVGETLYTSIASPTFTVLPLFILMGALAARGGFAKQAFDGVYIMFARVPASLAIASSFGSAFFAAICGSSMATASVFGKVAYPAMTERNYDKTFALGSIASSGTFACMIPPSGMFILFGLFTGQSIATLFIAGIVPGVLTACVYSLSMYLRAKKNPILAPIAREEYDVTIPQRITAAFSLWPIILIGGGVTVGLYTGFFTPTEAGAVGTLGTLIFGLCNNTLRSASAIKSALRESASTATMLIFIIITALIFSRFLALTQLPMELADFLQAWEVPRLVILISILVLWFILGMFMAQAAVFALTLPILFPIILKVGYDPIWFCIIAMKLNEIAGVSPPVGLNAFSLAGAVTGKDDDVTIESIYKGCFPFIFCDIVILIMLFIFPEIVTFLPNLMLAG